MAKRLIALYLLVCLSYAAYTAKVQGSNLRLLTDVLLGRDTAVVGGLRNWVYTINDQCDCPQLTEGKYVMYI